MLEANDLWVSFDGHSGEAQAVRGASFDVRQGETLAIVGESGSGKTVAARSTVRLLPENCRVKKGQVIFEGKDILHLPNRQMQALRGHKISMVLQDPMSSLDPTMKIGKQIAESLRKHTELSRREARLRAIELLRLVGLPDPERQARRYPHQFSGGMCQRVVIAIALACDPQVLIADEPTTALDVTIQAQIIELLRDLQDRLGMSIILITHDLGVVAQIAHRVAVMYAGKIVEVGTRHEIFYEPKHPYTWGLLGSVPRLSAFRTRDLEPITGTPPEPTRSPEGCPFAARCPHALRICVAEMPENWVFSEEHTAACWLHHEMAPDLSHHQRGQEA